ncbi:MAG: ATPase [Bacteroidetes bacterium]|nr:MAG: ATPase [Bacteroidota bacterium]
MLKKIVAIGPESTGKSTLCTQLAAALGGVYCAEYARQYMLENGTDYDFDTLLTIAKGQMAAEAAAETALVAGPTAGGLIFLDTNQYVMKVWCEYVFNDCHRWILNHIATAPYDLYLLCRPDVPWVKDELREYPNEKPRQQLYHMYKDLLMHQHVPWVEVSGNYAQRFELAKRAVEKLGASNP